MNTTKTTVTPAHLNTWLVAAQALVDDYMARRFPTLPREVLTVEPGRRYARVVRSHGEQRSAYCFIDLQNGDILKTATWRAPAKHPRGNIFAPDPVAGLGPYGADYLR